MASPPFDINSLVPGDSDIASQFPATERTFRDIVESWLLINHNDLGQHKKLELASLATPTGAAGIGVLWQESGVLKYRTAGDAIDFTMDLGKLTLFPTGAVGLVLESAAATDIAAEFKGSGGSVFVGQGADETFAVKGDSNLDTSPWFSVSAAAAALAVPLSLTTPLAVAQGGTGAATAADARTNLGVPSSSNPTFAGLTVSGGLLKLAAGAALSIASGAITVTNPFHTVDTEADAASDNLDTINGGTDGAFVILTAEVDRNVVIKNGTGNIVMSSDFTLDNRNSFAGLRHNGTEWRLVFSQS